MTEKIETDVEIDVAATLEKIERDGITEPDDGKVILKFLQVLNKERSAANRRIEAIENDRLSATQAAQLIELIGNIAERMKLIETQLASLQRLSSKPN